MRVIITGGTGLIGRALTAALVARGDEVIVLSRDPKQSTGVALGARIEKWDGETSRGWGSLVDGTTAIVNLAGAGIASGRWTAERKRLIRESRLNAARAVVQAVRDAGERPRVVVQASAVGYYGPLGDDEVAEKAAPGTDFLARVCVDWEAGTAPIEELGVRRAVIRTGVVLSTRGGALPRMLLPYRFFVGGPLASGRQGFSWIHLDDEVGAIVFLLDQEAARGPYNLTAPTPLTNAQFGRVLGRVLGRPSLFPTPAIALRLLFGEMATALVDGQQVAPKRLLEHGFTFRYANAEKALQNLLR